MNDCPFLLTAFSARPEDPAYRAIAGVLDAASAGKLPAFAQWLGLEEKAFWQMLDHCFPGARAAGWVPDQPRDTVTLPCEFADLIEMLEADCRTASREAEWATYALACGCFGKSHLWHDMGLTGREDVSTLLQLHFAPLFAANVHNMKWKKFFYHRVCERLDLHPCPEPSCEQCNNHAACHGSESAVVFHRSSMA